MVFIGFGTVASILHYLFAYEAATKRKKHKQAESERQVQGKPPVELPKAAILSYALGIDARRNGEDILTPTLEFLPDRYFKPVPTGDLTVARLKGQHVLACLELIRQLALGKHGDIESAPNVRESCAWDTEEIFERL